MARLSVILAVLPPGINHQESAAGAIVLSHAAPARATAGDSLILDVQATLRCHLGSECSGMALTAHYDRPGGHSGDVSAPTSNASTQKLSMTLPGNDIRYPSLSYYLEASYLDGPARICSSSPSACRRISKRLPAQGKFKVPVKNVVRFGIRRPDGSPAAGLQVMGGPLRNGAVWEGTTNPEGLLVLPIPDKDPRILESAANPGFMNVFLRAFDSWPKSAPPPDREIKVKGNGLHLGTVVNLGNPRVDAVDPQTQDKWLTLEPEEASFVSSANSEWFCSTHACTYKDIIGPFNVPLTKKLGGGAEMESDFLYQSSDYTKTTFAVQAFGSNEWVQGKGEVGAEKSEETTTTINTPFVGPNQNKKVETQWYFMDTRTQTCKDGEPDYPPPCQRSHEIVPYQWTTGTLPLADVPGFHDQARPPGGPDCTFQSNLPTSTSAERGSKESFSFEFGGGLVPLSARTSFDDTQTRKSEFSWRVVNDTGKFHHRYVRDGLATPGELTPGEDRCPRTHPGAVWTDTSDTDKTNPTTGNMEHPPGCHLHSGAVFTPCMGRVGTKVAVAASTYSTTFNGTRGIYINGPVDPDVGGGPTSAAPSECNIAISDRMGDITYVNGVGTGTAIIPATVNGRAVQPGELYEMCVAPNSTAGPGATYPGWEHFWILPT